MSDEMRSPLARRLAALEIAVPSTLVPRVLAGRGPGARATDRRLLPRLAAAAALAVLAIAAASYFAPRFSQALADAPVVGTATGPLLRSVGLAGIAGRVTALSDSATSSGYRVTVLGGYADGIRTIIVLRVEPAGRNLYEGTSLTDQFGRRLELRGAATNSLTGEEVLEFDSITGPAAILGARLTLHASALAVPGGGDRLAGDWQLHATIALDESRTLDRPAAGRIGAMTCTFTALTASPTAIRVRVQVLGAAPGALTKVIPDAIKGHPAFQLELWGPDGTAGQLLTSNVDGASGSIDAVWARSLVGTYRLVVSYAGTGSFERNIEVQ